jgi:hypothetical protein
MAGSMSQKNMMLSPASVDLGLGGSQQLQQQMQAKMEEIRKKKKDGQQSDALSPAGMMLLNPTFNAGGGNG